MERFHRCGEPIGIYDPPEPRYGYTALYYHGWPPRDVCFCPRCERRIEATDMHEMPRVDWQVGQAVTWLRERRGGYGSRDAIPATVRSMGKRVKILLQSTSGDQVERSVDPLNLRERRTRDGRA